MRQPCTSGPGHMGPVGYQFRFAYLLTHSRGHRAKAGFRSMKIHQSVLKT
jgi:hypothetical protein